MRVSLWVGSLMVGTVLPAAGCMVHQVPPPEQHVLDPVAYHSEASAGDPTGFGLERQYPGYRNQVQRNQRRLLEQRTLQASPGKTVYVRGEHGTFERVLP